MVALVTFGEPCIPNSCVGLKMAVTDLFCLGLGASAPIWDDRLWRCLKYEKTDLLDGFIG